MFEIKNSTKITRCSNAVAAGQTTVNGSILDMTGYNRVAFVLALGAISATGTPSLKIQHGDDSGLSDAADVSGSSVAYTASDDNKLAVAELAFPTKRYVRAVVTRPTADAVIDSLIGIQHDARVEPTTHDSSTVVGSALVTGP